MFWQCSAGVVAVFWLCSGSVVAVSSYIVQPVLALRNIKALSVYMGSGLVKGLVRNGCTQRSVFETVLRENRLSGFFQYNIVDKL